MALSVDAVLELPGNFCFMDLGSCKYTTCLVVIAPSPWVPSLLTDLDFSFILGFPGDAGSETAPSLKYPCATFEAYNNPFSWSQNSSSEITPMPGLLLPQVSGSVPPRSDKPSTWKVVADFCL